MAFSAQSSTKYTLTLHYSVFRWLLGDLHLPRGSPLLSLLRSWLCLALCLVPQVTLNPVVRAEFPVLARLMEHESRMRGIGHLAAFVQFQELLLNRNEKEREREIQGCRFC